MNLLETFRDAGALEAEPWTSRLLGSLQITLLGMGLTFLALVLVWLAVRVFSRLFAEKRAAPGKTFTDTPIRPVPEEDDGARAAAIAAVLAVLGETPPERFRVRRITRGPSPASRWTGR